MTRDDEARFYDRQGQPMSTEAWQQAYEDFDLRKIGSDVVGDGYVVTTVWLGHDDDDHEPPHIFGTEVQGRPGRVWEIRYATENEALLGHADAVAKAIRGEFR